MDKITMNEKQLIIAINCIDSRSSGFVMRSALDYAKEKGDYDFFCITPHCSSKDNHFQITWRDIPFPFNYIYRLFLQYIIRKKHDGFGSVIFTLGLSNKIRKLSKNYLKKPIIHIHCLHDTPFNYSYLLRFFKRINYSIVYTFHDVWPFTGYCVHIN